MWVVTHEFPVPENPYESVGRAARTEPISSPDGATPFLGGLFCWCCPRRSNSLSAEKRHFPHTSPPLPHFLPATQVRFDLRSMHLGIPVNTETAAKSRQLIFPGLHRHGATMAVMIGCFSPETGRVAPTTHSCDCPSEILISDGEAS